MEFGFSLGRSGLHTGKHRLQGYSVQQEDSSENMRPVWGREPHLPQLRGHRAAAGRGRRKRAACFLFRCGYKVCCFSSQLPHFFLVHPMEIIIPDLFQACFDYKRKINTYGTLRKKITPHKYKLLGCTVLGLDRPLWTREQLARVLARARVQLLSDASRSCFSQKGDMEELWKLG